MLVLLAAYSCDGHEKIRKLRKQVRELTNDPVSLVPGASGYRPIRHQLGSAAISLIDVKADKKGSAVTLEIVNLTSVTFEGATMTLGYQDPQNAGLARSQSYNVDQALEAGKATRITLALEELRPSAVNFVRVSDFQPKAIRVIPKS